MINSCSGQTTGRGAMNIIEFLEARIAEDEAAARNAAEWVASGPTPNVPWFGAKHDAMVRNFGGAGEHIARHDPARVLAECAAKRAIIALHDQGGMRWEGFPRADKQVTYCLEDQHPAPCSTLCAVAAAYKDHPGYRQEWA